MKKGVSYMLRQVGVKKRGWLHDWCKEGRLIWSDKFMDRKVRSLEVFENTRGTDLKDLSDGAYIQCEQVLPITCFHSDMVLFFHWWSYSGAVKGDFFNLRIQFRPDGMIPDRPEDFLIWISRPLEGGGHPAKFFTGRLTPGVHPLTLLYTIFAEERQLGSFIGRRVVRSILTRSSEFFLSFLVSQFSFLQILLTNGTPSHS